MDFIIRETGFEDVDWINLAAQDLPTMTLFCEYEDEPSGPI
jgi:hypothetical protein